MDQKLSIKIIYTNQGIASAVPELVVLLYCHRKVGGPRSWYNFCKNVVDGYIYGEGVNGLVIMNKNRKYLGNLRK